MDVYRDGQFVATHVCQRGRWIYQIPPEQRQSKTYVRLKLRDILAARYFFRLIAATYPDCPAIDYFIGVESINALLGYAARRRLRIRKTVFYIFDWSLQRYANALMNKVFLLLDRWACERADFIWNISWAIEKARRDFLHYDPRRIGLQLTVPYGAEFRQSLVQPFEALEKYKVIFTGGFYEDNGVLMLMEIASEVQKRNPRVQFLLAGDGPLLEQLRSQERERGVRNVTFLGHIHDHERLDKLMCQGLIGLAPYPDTQVSTKKYGDVIKIRTYLACGLVVVSTHIPPVAKEIADEHLGIVTPVNAPAMAEAILELCADEPRLRQCRENVIRKAGQHSWDDIFDRTFRRMAGSAEENRTKS